jgi:hypothetical protein
MSLRVAIFKLQLHLRDDMNSQKDFIYTKAHGAAEKILQFQAFKVKCREAFSINV